MTDLKLSGRRFRVNISRSHLFSLPNTDHLQSQSISVRLVAVALYANGMKVKQLPEDFQVEEQTAVTPGEQGSFALYRLSKIGWTTLDAIQVIRRRWQIDARRIAYGGLKDRHARTVQYLTIAHGPRRHLSHNRLHLHYLGQVPQAYGSEDIQANRFVITIRDLSRAAAEQGVATLASLATVGVPNYFDDQRFGSVGLDNAFVAAAMVRGDYAQALRQALAMPSRYDRAAGKREKAILTAHWGNWTRCKEQLPRGHARSIVDYLVNHPEDFRGAVLRLKPELLELYLSAYQSHLWNQLLAAWIEAHIPNSMRTEILLRMGSVPMPTAIPDAVRPAWEMLHLPLPSARMHHDPEATWAPLLETVLTREGLTWQTLRLKGCRRPFFSRGDRPGVLMPSNMEQHIDDDDRHPGKQKWQLHFDLPRGCYATMLLKRLTGSPSGTAQANQTS